MATLKALKVEEQEGGQGVVAEMGLGLPLASWDCVACDIQIRALYRCLPCCLLCCLPA